MELVELGLLPENLFGDIKLPSETIWIPTGVSRGEKDRIVKVTMAAELEAVFVVPRTVHFQELGRTYHE